MTNINDSTLVVWSESEEDEDVEFSVVFVSKQVYLDQDEWYGSYNDSTYSDVVDEVANKFNLDGYMECEYSADDAESYAALVAALNADDRFAYVDSLYELDEN